MPQAAQSRLGSERLEEAPPGGCGSSVDSILAVLHAGHTRFGMERTDTCAGPRREAASA
jgi:hypothetical protein